MNLYDDWPASIDKEILTDLLTAPDLRIERILSRGQTSPEEGWYDQNENEWVIVLEGAGTIEFENGRSVTLRRGDSLNIPAHVRHRVSWTDPERVTLWLAVFYG